MAKVLFAALLLLVAASVPAAAQSVRLDETSATWTYPLDALRVAIDPSGTLTLNDVRNAPGRFAPPNYAVRTVPIPQRYWVRCEVVSGFDHDVRYAVPSSNWDEIDVFVIHGNGSISEMHGGQRQPIIDPVGKMRTAQPVDPFRPATRARASAYLTFDLRAHERATIYARLGWYGYFTTVFPGLSLDRFDDTLERTRFALYLDGAIVGILLALAIYSSVISASVRDLSYLWYAVYLFAIMISCAAQYIGDAPLLTQFIIPRHPLVTLVLKRLSDPVAWIALVFFTRSFFRTFARFPVWDKALIATAALIAITAPVGIFRPEQMRIVVWVWQAAIFLCLATGIMASLNGVRSTYFIFGQSIVALGSSIQAAESSGLLSLYDVVGIDGVPAVLAYKVVFTSSVVDALIFSLALSDRLLSSGRR